jgi:hypothetical protein
LGNANFEHSRDFRPVQTYVVVKGVGQELVDGVPQVVYAVYNAHADAYPCRYLPNGWGRAPWSNADIGTLADARAVAEAIGARAWGALGQLAWDTDLIPEGATTPVDLDVGDLIALTNPQEGQDYAIYPVLEINPVGGTLGHPVYHLVVGEAAPDFEDIINQITSVRRVQDALTQRGGAAQDVTLGPGGTPGSPKDVPPTRTATHSERNVAMGQYNDVTAFTTRGGTQDRDPTAPADPTAYAPQFRAQYYDATTQTWQNGTTISGQDGRPHPQTFMLAFTADGTSDPYIGHWDMDLSVIRLKGTGSCTLNANGVTVAGPFTAPGVFTFTPVHYSVADPTDPDDWSVTVSGVSGSLSVTVTET